MADNNGGYRGVRLFLKWPHGYWSTIVKAEAEENEISVADFVLEVFKLGYEVYRDQGLHGELRRRKAG